MRFLQNSTVPGRSESLTAEFTGFSKGGQRFRSTNVLQFAQHMGNLAHFCASGSSKKPFRLGSTRHKVKQAKWSCPKTETLILCHQLCLGTMASLLCPGKMVHKWPKVTSRTKHNPRGRVRYCSPSRALPPVKREGIPSQNRVLQNDNPQQYHPIYTLSFKKKKEYIRANVSSV